jgi:putative MFS transporter
MGWWFFWELVFFGVSMNGGSEGSESGEILARLDRIPCWPYPRAVLAIVGAGIFFAFFDIVTIAAALPVLVKQLGVTAEAASRAVTFSLFGYIVGAFLVSRLADRVGRRFALLV